MRIRGATESELPISETALGRLYRASPQGLAILVRTIPPQTRAMLAIYCLQHENLSSIGLAIADTCGRRDLLCQGGSAALDLIQWHRMSKGSADSSVKQSAA